MVTPGLCLEVDTLDARSENLLVAISGDRGLAALEFSTGSLRACELPDDAALIAELARLEPAELLLPDTRKDLIPLVHKVAGKIPIRLVQASDRSPSGHVDLRPEMPDDDAAMLTAAARHATRIALGYAAQSQPGQLPKITRVSPYTPSDHLQLDEVVIRNLEIVQTLQGQRTGSLLALLDDTKTSMGARALRRRLLAPLTNLPRSDGVTMP